MTFSETATWNICLDFSGVKSQLTVHLNQELKKQKQKLSAMLMTDVFALWIFLTLSGTTAQSNEGKHD